MLAVYHGHAATAAALIARGADVNKPNNEGQFPLPGAAFAGHVELVAMLIDAGADPARPCRDGGTPLQFAELFGRHSVGTLLRERLGKPPRRGVAGSKTRVVSSGARTSRKTAPKAQAPEETLTQNGATGNQTRETSSKGDPVNDDLKHSDRLADAETTR